MTHYACAVSCAMVEKRDMNWRSTPDRLKGLERRKTGNETRQRLFECIFASFGSMTSTMAKETAYRRPTNRDPNQGGKKQ